MNNLDGAGDVRVRDESRGRDPTPRLASQTTSQGKRKLRKRSDSSSQGNEGPSSEARQGQSGRGKGGGRR